MIMRRTSAAGTALVTLPEAKAHLRVTGTAEDALIAALITAASDFIGESSGRVLALETWKIMCPGFLGTVKLPKSPLIAITEIGYNDTAGAALTANLSDFSTIIGDDWGYICPKSGKSWPTSDTARLDGASITFTAGYSVLPDALRMAVLLMVGHYYVNREAVGATQSELPLAVESLVASYRLGWAAA